MKKIKRVLSLFDGMSTLQTALTELGYEFEYFASEIKPHAIKLTQHHYPKTVQLGDITKWKEWDIDWNFDFIGSGSPCQDLSAAGKRAGINGSKSSLFFTFVEILEHIKTINPNVLFLQENVGSASKLDVGIMSRALGVYPVRINSGLLTAQLRDRYYWTNIRTKETIFDVVSDIPQPKDKGIILKDIITSGYVDRNKSLCLLEGVYSKKPKKEYLKYMNRYLMGMMQIVYESEFDIRILNKIEMCRLQGFKDNHCDILTDAQAGSLLGDGWTLPVIKHILSFID